MPYCCFSKLFGHIYRILMLSKFLRVSGLSVNDCFKLFFILNNIGELIPNFRHWIQVQASSWPGHGTSISQQATEIKLRSIYSSIPGVYIFL